MTPELADFLARTNPWLQDPARLARLARHNLPPKWIPRLATEDLDQVLEDPRKAHLLVGPRQAGKSSLTWAMLTRRSEPLLYVPCDNALIEEWSRNPHLAALDIAALVPVGGRVFLEEAQALTEAGRFIKGLIDARIARPLVATGSASFHLLSRTRESLAGRATRHHLWPLSLAEVAAPIQAEPPALFHQRRRRAIEGMMLFGGYPEAWTAPEPQPVLSELVDAFVLRDASDRFRVGHPGAFRRLLGLAAGQIGQVVNHSEWGRVLGISSTTVSDYLTILEETHILRRPRPYVGGKRAELTRAPKVFFVDNGLRNQLRGGFTELERRADVGPLHENLVFSELVKRFTRPGSIRCWRTSNGAEVDFVLEPEPERLIGIEVKASTEARPRLPRGCRSFISAYAPEQFWMVTRGPAWEDTLGQTRLRGVPLELLPEALDAL